MGLRKKGVKMSYEDFIKSKEFKIINKSVEIQREDLNKIYLNIKKI